MPDFSYIAINKDGVQVKGSIEASDANSVKAKLKLDGLTPVSIKTQSVLTKDIEIGGGKRVKPRDLAIFCRQFSSVLNAGVTVVEALRMLGEQTANKTLRDALFKTKELVQQGETLASAMHQSPKIFPEMFVNMVEAGEESGSLDICVSRMGTHFEKSSKINGLVKRAMIYPIAIIIVALVVLIVMSVVVIPKFAEMFVEMGSELPGSTKAVLALSDLFIHKWYILIGVVLAVAFFISWFRTTETGKTFFGTIAIRMPIFGQLSQKSNAAKFARTMSTLVGSGLSITVAIEITARAISNVLYKRALANAKAEVEQGIPLSVPIRKSGVFPPMVHNMLGVGEQTGNIEGMLDKVADYYEEETEIATASLTELMQPLIIVVLGAMVGWLVVAMYQPMIGMYNDIGNL